MLKIIRAIIENYKCHKKSMLELTNFHVLIGANNSGKSSVIEVFELIKNNLWRQLPDVENKVFGGISDNELKEISITVELELSEDERMRYATDFGLVNLYTDKIKPTSFLKKVSMKFSVLYTIKPSDSPFENALIPPMISIFGAFGEYIPILKTLQDYRIQFKTFPMIEPEYLKQNKMSLDEYFKDSKNSQTITLNEYIRDNPYKVPERTIVYDFLNLLEFIPTNRLIIKSDMLRTLKPQDAADRRKDLLPIIYTQRSKDRIGFERLVETARLIHPDISGLDNNITDNSQITLSIKKNNLLTFLNEQGSGFENIIYFVWYISLSKPGTIWFIDEPELHLHPLAQSHLYDFLVNETSEENGRQIIVISQSMIFVHKSKPSEITLTSIAETIGKARTITLQSLVNAEKNVAENSQPEQVRQYIYQILGYDPTLGLEPRTIVLVEGKADKEIFSEFAKILDKPLDPRRIMLIPVWDKTRVKKYGPYMGRAAIGKNILIILDKDNDSQKQTQQEIIAEDEKYSSLLGMTRLLTEQNFFFFPEYVYSIEYFLLDADAICKAAGERDPAIIKDIHSRINQEKQKEKIDKPKELLETIWNTWLEKGPYDSVDTPKLIASNMARETLEANEQIQRLITALHK